MTSVQGIIGRLTEAPVSTSAGESVFEPTSIEPLPEPARRWLRHAIAPGTSLYRRAELTMHGTIRLGRWRTFTARQELVPDLGFIWAAHTKIAGMPVRGYDSLANGVGVQHWRAAGLVAVQSATGADVTRSALDRLAAEAVLIPSALLDASWQPGQQPGTATYRRPVAGLRSASRITIRVNADGRLRLLTMGRWGNPSDAGFGEYGFRVDFAGERRVQGIATPTDLSAAWLLPGGAWLEFFRAQIDSITFS